MAHPLPCQMIHSASTQCWKTHDSPFFNPISDEARYSQTSLDTDTCAPETYLYYFVDSEKICEFKHGFYNNTKKVPTFLLHFPVVFCTKFLGEKVCYHLRERLVSGLFWKMATIQYKTSQNTALVDISELFVAHIFPKYDREVSFMK